MSPGHRPFGRLCASAFERWCAAARATSTEFSPEKPCEAVVTQNTLQVFYQCESPDVWLVLTMRKGGRPRPGVPPPVENDGASDDRVLRMQQLARMCWNTFTLFHGNTKNILARQGRQGRDGWDAVRGALREFMPRYLPGIQLDRPGDVLMALGGMHFLPVDKQSYLRIQLMINALEMRFRTIVGTVFLYDGDLISSGLEMEPTRLIYAFLSAHLFGEPARRPDPAPKRSGGLLGGFGLSGESSPRDRPAECGMDIGVTAARWDKHFDVMHAADAGKGMMPLHTVYIGGDVGHVGRVPREPDPEPEPEPEAASGQPGSPPSASNGPAPARYHLLVYSQPPATLVFVFAHPDGPFESVASATAAARTVPKAAGPDLADFTTFIKPMLEQELMNLAQAICSGGRRKANVQQPSGAHSSKRTVSCSHSFSQSNSVPYVWMIRWWRWRGRRQRVSLRLLQPDEPRSEGLRRLWRRQNGRP